MTNPYESPRIPAEAPQEDDDETPVAWPATGAFRYYQSLVWQTATALPTICVRTGLPADDTLTLTMRSLIDDDGSLPPTFQVKGRRLYDVTLPVNVKACKRRDRRLLGLVFWSLAIAVGLACAFASELLPTLAIAGMVLAAVILGVAGSRFLIGPQPIQLVCVDRGYLQLFGVHPVFLAALPLWPVPDRDSRSRRLETT